MVARYEAKIHQTPTDEYTPDIHFKFKTMSELFTFLDTTLIHGQTDMEIIIRRLDFIGMEEKEDD
jgi:hypothetical protein